MRKKETDDKAGRAVTMEDVARKAGVNIATVSRALRNLPRVAPSTRRKVERAAKALGYRPNPFVQAFAAHMRGCRPLPDHTPLAMFSAGNRPDATGFQRYVKGIETKAAEHGFRIDFFGKEQVGGSLDRLRQIVMARNTRALLILPVPHGMDCTALTQFPLAMATIDYTLKSPGIHRAAPAYFHNMELALQGLTERGARRIAFCTSPTETAHIGPHWLGAFCGWGKRHTPSGVLAPYFARLDGNTAPARQHFLAWIKRNQPDAIVANNCCFLDWMQEAGIPVPGQIKFVHLGDYSKTPDLTRVSQNQTAIGAAAFDLILGQLHRNEYGVPKHMKTVLVYGEWVDGWTA